GDDGVRRLLDQLLAHVAAEVVPAVPAHGRRARETVVERGPGGAARPGRHDRGNEQRGEQWLGETRVHATFSWSSRSFAPSALRMTGSLAPRTRKDEPSQSATRRVILSERAVRARSEGSVVQSQHPVSSRAPGSSRPARRAARDGWRAAPGSPGSSLPPAGSTAPRRARTPA